MVRKKQHHDLAIDSNSIPLLEEEYCADFKLWFGYRIIKTNIRATWISHFFLIFVLTNEKFLLFLNYKIFTKDVTRKPRFFEYTFSQKEVESSKTNYILSTKSLHSIVSFSTLQLLKDANLCQTLKNLFHP